MKKTIALFILLVSVFYATLNAQNTVKSSYTVPVYNFNELEPFLHTESDTVFVVNFWATWCIPCVQELPNFLKLDSIYKTKKVKVLLVSLDMKSKMNEQLIPYIEKKNIKSKVVLLSDMDQNAWIPKVDAKWDGTIPCTIIFDKNKRKFFPKEFTYTELQTELLNFKNN